MWGHNEHMSSVLSVLSCAGGRLALELILGVVVAALTSTVVGAGPGILIGFACAAATFVVSRVAAMCPMDAVQTQRHLAREHLTPATEELAVVALTLASMAAIVILAATINLVA